MTKILLNWKKKRGRESVAGQREKERTTEPEPYYGIVLCVGGLSVCLAFTG